MLDAVEEMVEGCLMSRSRMIARDLTTMYDEELRPFGVQASQLILLASVAYMGPVRRSEVGKTLHLDTSTLTRNLRVMENNGWIEEANAGADGRGRPIRISESGRKLLAQAFPAWRRAQRSASRLLGDDGKATLMRLTNHLPG
jgi:DNA-binding MarR family transcriptional regulator